MGTTARERKRNTRERRERGKRKETRMKRCVRVTERGRWVADNYMFKILGSNFNEFLNYNISISNYCHKTIQV